MRMRRANNFCDSERKAAQSPAQDENTGAPHWYHDADGAKYFPEIIFVGWCVDAALGPALLGTAPSSMLRTKTGPSSRRPRFKIKIVANDFSRPLFFDLYAEAGRGRIGLAD